MIFSVGTMITMYKVQTSEEGGEKNEEVKKPYNRISVGYEDQT